MNGRKTFITNGAVDDTTLGDVFLVYARTGEREISTFVVEKGFSGFQLGQRWKDKLGVRASMTAELVFDNCRVPADRLLGHEGESMKHMMRNLEIERLTLAAMSLGIALRCLQVMVDYANQRHSFGVTAPRAWADPKAYRRVVRGVQGGPLLRVRHGAAARPA